nr:daf-12-interacting protein 1-like [Procambarus clarkii]
MLRLLLVVGAVTCSPLPSDLPSLTAHDATHVQVTHEVRHVTFEVSEEVNEATAASQATSGELPEDDPPIPTATTPPTSPDNHPLGGNDQESGETEQGHSDYLHALPATHQDGTRHSDGTVPEEATDVTHAKAVPTGVRGQEQQEEEAHGDHNDGEVVVDHHAGAGSAQGHTPGEHEEIGELLDKRSHVRGVEETSEGKSESAEEHAEGAEEHAEGAEEHAEGAEEYAEATEKHVEESEEHAGAEERAKGVEEQIEEHADVAEEHTEGIKEHTEGVTAETVKTPGTEELGAVSVRAMEPVRDLDSEESAELGQKGSQEEVPTFVMGSLADIDVVERSDADEAIVREGTPESEGVAETAPEETRVLPPKGLSPETIRKSRVYIEDPREDSEEITQAEKPSTHVGSGTKLASSGLEIMSMTSPTPEAPPEVSSTEGQVEEPSLEDADISTEIPRNSSLAEESDEGNEDSQPDVVSETPSEIEPVVGHSEQGEPVGQTEGQPKPVPAEVPDTVTTITPLDPSPAPHPGEEYTDSYNDPLNNGDLPDFDVTKEELPSQEHPIPEVPPTHPNTGKVGEDDSRDLAAGDHMLEVDSGTSWALPPQQEQVSALAPDSLTPGCIVGIVFGVLLSLVVILGVGGFVVWQRRTLNRPKVLGSDRGYAGSDSGGYIDDQVRVSYVNSQIDTPKGSPEDLISLDNDSFLNSLESMTIQNLWTDNIRHTKL